jgi:hypothetical protein
MFLISIHSVESNFSIQVPRLMVGGVLESLDGNRLDVKRGNSEQIQHKNLENAFRDVLA